LGGHFSQIQTSKSIFQNINALHSCTVVEKTIKNAKILVAVKAVKRSKAKTKYKEE